MGVKVNEHPKESLGGNHGVPLLDHTEIGNLKYFPVLRLGLTPIRVNRDT